MNPASTLKYSLSLVLLLIVFANQKAHAQYSLTILKVNPSHCLKAGDTLTLLGRGFGNSSNKKTIVISIANNEFIFDKVNRWAPTKIIATVPKIPSKILQTQSRTKKHIIANIGIRSGKRWVSNQDRTIALCTTIHSSPTNRLSIAETSPITPSHLRLPPPNLSRDIDVADQNKTNNQENENRGNSNTGRSQSQSNTQQESLTPRSGGGLYSLGIPPTPNIDNKGETKESAQETAEAREQREAKELIVLSASLEEAIKLAENMQAIGVRIKRRTRHSHLGIVKSILGVPNNTSTTNLLRQLREADPNLWIDYNHRYRLLSNETAADPKQWAFEQVSRQRTHELCSKGLRIGLIDTGISPQTPLPHSQIIEKSFIPNGATAAPKHHATAIASLLLGSNEYAILGLTPQITLYSAAIFRQQNKKKNDTTAEFILAALNWLSGNQVRVINMSFGGPRNLPLEWAIDVLSKRGTTVIASAGIDSKNRALYPAAQETTIAVRAIDLNKAAFNPKISGDYIDYAAPGVDLWLLKADGKAKYFSGSSFAAPFVAASYALLSRQHKQLKPEKLTETVEDIGDQGKDPYFGHGLIRLPPVC